MLRIGFAKQCITPSLPIHLAGYAARWGKKANAVHDDIFIKAAYFDNEEQTLLMLFADVEGVQETVYMRIRTQIEKELGIQTVALSCTHTHSAPHTYPQLQLQQEELDAAWLKAFEQKAIRAATDAVRDASPAQIGFAQTLVPEIARNRRSGHSETDPTLTAIKVVSPDGELRGILLNYPCHCTVLDGTSFSVSADYPGHVYAYFEREQPGIFVAFSNGAAADINIGYSSDASALGEPMATRTHENAASIGTLLAQRAEQALAHGATYQNISMRAAERELALPLREDLPSERDIHAQIDALEKQIQIADEEQKRALKLQVIYLQCVLLRLPKQTVLGNLLVHSMEICLGPLTFITIPGELFTQTALALKRRYQCDGMVAILGYTNGYVGYIPPRDAMEEGGYEAKTSIFAPHVAESLLTQLECEL